MSELYKAGILGIMSARLDGVLVGYLTWNVHTDPESKGLPVAYQGGLFVKDDRSLIHYGIGLRLYKRSIEELKKLGVKQIFPHYRNRGRGAALDKFFTKKLGAVEVQRGYSLWIGD